MSFYCLKKPSEKCAFCSFKCTSCLESFCFYSYGVSHCSLVRLFHTNIWSLNWGFGDFTNFGRATWQLEMKCRGAGAAHRVAYITTAENRITCSAVKWFLKGTSRRPRCSFWFHDRPTSTSRKKGWKRTRKGFSFYLFQQKFCPPNTIHTCIHAYLVLLKNPLHRESRPHTRTVYVLTSADVFVYSLNVRQHFSVPCL
jgi:hypothetical protein